MNKEYLRLAELIPTSPWIERDIGMIATCNQACCMYCNLPKEVAHSPSCPWPELKSLANKMRKDWQEKYGTKVAIKKERWNRNYKEPDFDDDHYF